MTGLPQSHDDGVPKSVATAAAAKERVIVPNQPLVVALPGALCAPAIFREVASHSSLSRTRLVSISWLTEGSSWTLPAVAERVIARCAEMTDAPVVLAGHSTGGTVALLAALEAPERVCGLLLSNTGANMHGHGDVEAVIAGLESDYGPEARKQVLDRCFHYAPEPVIREELDCYASAVAKHAIIDALRSQLETDLAPRLAELSMPVCIAHGQHDRVRPASHAEFLAKNIPGAEMILLDAGHTPMLERPAAYARALDSLLKRCPNTSTI